MLALPAVVERLAAEGAEPTPSTPAGFRDFLGKEIEVWGGVVREARVQLD